MENNIKTINTIITLIGIYGYLSAIYEFVIKHNVGLGIVLTLVSLILSLAVIGMRNLEKVREYVKANFTPKHISNAFKVITVLHIFIWIVTFFLWGHKGASVFTVLFFGFILYNMPVIFSMITLIFCFITQKNKDKYLSISLFVSLVLSIILLLVFILADTSLPWLIFEIVCQFIPFCILFALCDGL